MKELSLEMKERIVEEILNEFRQGNAINGTFLIKKIFAITNNDLGEDVEKIIGMLEDSLDNSIYYIMETYSEQLLTPGEYEAVNELQDFIDAVNYVKIAYDLILTSKDCMELKKMEKDFLELEKECKKDPDNQEKYELLQRQRSEKIKKENDIVGTLLGIPISFIKKFPGFGTYAACTLEGGLLCLDKGTELLIRHREQLEDSLRDILKGTGIIISLDAESSREIFRQRDIFNFISRSKLSKENKRMQESQEKFKKAWDDMKKVAGKVGEKIKDIVKGTEGKINDNGVEKIKDAQGDVTRPYDPLVVDLNHNGFDLHSVENGVYFDLDNNGTKEKTSWVDKQDGFLVMDQNGNGKIDTGAELFGEKVLLKNGQYSDGAIDVLSEFDENGDGIIDDKDSVFDKLMIWQDLNHNGISEEGELKTLKEHHIVGLKLTDIQSHQRNIAGSTLRKSMTYIYEETVTNEKGEEIKSQKEGTIGEFLLAKDNIDTHDTEQGQDMLSQLDLSKEDEAALYHTVKNLPDIRSFGRFKRLHNAMVLDKSGVLVGLVQQFQNSKNSAERENLLEQILLFMADATDVDASTKGQYANAKHIKVLEHVFDNPLREGVLDKRLGQTYEDAYHDIKSVYYTTLSMQTSLKDMQEFFLSKENKLINIALLNKYLELQLLQDKENSEFLFEETTKVLMYLDSLGIEGFEQFKHHFGSLSTRYFHKFAELNVKQYRENTDNTTTYLYTKGVTIHAGDGNNIIQGTFNGPSGNDYIYAGKGNDMIYGGTGSDTYFFEKGDGNDTIKESINAKDTNIVVFGKGIKKENLQIRRLNHHDVKITIKGTDDSLTIQGQIQNNEKGAIDEFFFFDGERMTYKELKESANQITTGDDFIETTNDNDEIDLLSGDDTVYTKSGKDTIHGNAGADTIYAGEGDDILYGDEGSDKLYGENGEDTLIGGTGDDYLNGGYGADTYLFHKGDGIDTIEEYDYNTQNIDKIQLDKDIKKEDIILNRKGNDLEITFKAGNDKIIVKNQFANANSTIEQIVYGNNQIIAFQEMLDTTNQNSIKEHLLQGAYTDDILVGSQESDTIHGYDGQDQITGGKGDDILDGGYGNDTYYYNKGDGSDIITDYSGNNTLILGEGISKDKVVFTRVSREDIVMSIVGTEDKITIKNQWNNRTIDKVQFHDGSSLTYDQIKSIVNTPTDRDDYLEGTNGADILEGGKGNDHLNGGYGGDTYVFSRGDGQDTIEDYSGGYEGVDKLIFKDINREDVIFSRESEKDITILVKNSNDKIKIKYGNNPYHAIEEIHFANGEVMTYEEMMK
ncbi:MAG: calcium-binding protein, partial [Filifactor alocis]